MEKAKTEFHTHSEEMQELAEKMGNKYIKAVREYLDSVNEIIHSGSIEIDEAKIEKCYQSSEKLDRELAAA